MSKKVPKTKKAKKNSYQRISHAHEPRSRFLKRVLMYSAFTLLTIILTVLIFYRAKGYTFTKDGQVEKRGILLIDSAPVAAKIYIDDKDVGKETDYKLEVSEGDHTLRLEANGYRTWQTSFNIKSEQVEWFYYPYLMPTNLVSQNIQENIPQKTYSTLNSDGKVMAVSQSGIGRNQNFNLELLDLKESDPANISKPILVPTQIFSRQADGSLGSITFSSWSPNGDSIYLEHNYSGTKEILNVRVDAPVESTNISKTLGPGITQFRYDDRSRLYLLNSGKLSIHNPKTLVEESVIDSGVLNFNNFKDDKYVYAKNSPTNPTPSLDVYIKDGQKSPRLVTNISQGGASDLDFQYTINRRVHYLSISNLANKELLIYKNPLDSEENLEPLFLSTFKDLKSNQIKQSPAGSPQPGNYIALQLSANSVFIYSFEDETAITYSLQNLDITDISWIDSERLQARTSEGSIYYFDYDGNYVNQISKTNQSFSYFIGSENKTIVVNSSNPGQETLSQIKFKN